MKRTKHLARSDCELDSDGEEIDKDILPVVRDLERYAVPQKCLTIPQSRKCNKLVEVIKASSWCWAISEKHPFRVLEG